MFNLSSTSEKSEAVHFAKAIRRIFYILVFFTPLVYSNLTKEIFEFNKMFFVYFLGTTAIFLFIVSYVIKPFKLKTPNIFVLLFVATNLGATILSSHFYTSVWGYYSRFNGGMVSILVFFGLYFAGMHVLDYDKKDFNEKLWYAAALALIPIGLFSLLQLITLGTNTRVYSTFGQPNWLAAYVTMLMPLTLFRATRHRGLSSVFFYSLFILGFVSMWLSYSLSGLLGFLSGILAFLYINKKLFLKNTQNLKQLIVVLLVCIGFAFLTPGIYRQKAKDVFFDVNKVWKIRSMEQSVSNENTLNRDSADIELSIVGSNEQISDPGFIRTHLWKGTLSLATATSKNFLVGTGPETFTYEFQDYRPKELNYSSEWNYILNKPHNYYLEILAESGIFALAFYIGIIFWSVRKKHPFITPGLIAFFVTNFFGFPVVGTSLLFWVFVGGLNQYVR